MPRRLHCLVLVTLMGAIGVEGLSSLLTEADEILAGKMRLFGAEPVEINLAPAEPLAHWTECETNHNLLPALHLPHDDIKFA